MILKKKQFIPLHVHTAKGSIGDSTLKIKEYVARAKEYGLTHIAVTNHGSMADMYDFNDQCIKAGIEPIIGCEVYDVDDRLAKTKDDRECNHLVLIAKNEVGLRNLLYITTDAQLNGFYYHPRTDMSIMKEHGEGIIALSACLGGRIPKMIAPLSAENITQDQVDEVLTKVKQEIQNYKEVFDEFYLEIQPGNFKEQIFLNEVLVYLSQETDTPLVLTNDVHYLDEKDWHAHDIHVKIHRKKKIEDERIYPDTCYYFQSYSSISNSLPYLNYDVVQTAINNTISISNQCTLSLRDIKIRMPHFEVPEGHNEDSYLTKLCLERLEEIKNILVDPAGYATRLLSELGVISALGFSGYFLTVRDFVVYAKENGIPIGPGRGSICGSITAFLCDITDVDAIKYDLLFERFLSIHRKGSVPDIDLDFSADKRELMFKYAVAKHGLERCALVSTFGMRKAKASLRDIARVFNIPDELADEAAKLIPQVYYDDDGEKATDLSIKYSMEIVPRLKEIAEANPEWFDMSMKLEDLPRTNSIHAAGTLVSPLDLMGLIPLVKPNAEGINATALNLDDAEKAGFIKYDFLSLATLTVIYQTQRDVGYVFNSIEHHYNDENVWNLIGSKHTTCLFQIASKVYKDRMYRLKPKSIKQLAACLALVRGPCISSKADQIYMEIIEGTRQIELLHPFYDEVTSHTNGVLLYQEQLMNIAVKFGFTLEEGFKLMKAVSKKKIDKIKEYEEMFYSLADERNVPREATDKVWKIIVDAGLYCFNESHAVAYAILCYHSAYLKYYFPNEYMTNSLTNAYLRKEEIEEVIVECRRLGIRFLPLDVNESNWEFTLEEPSIIRVGMCAIKSFGEKSATEILEKRPFDSFYDFLDRIEKGKCTKRAIVPAIFTGLFSSFEPDRKEVYNAYCEYRTEEPIDVIKLQGGQEFNSGDPYDRIEELLLGAPLISSVVNSFIPIGFDDFKKGKTFIIDSVIRKVKKLKDRNQNNMVFLTLETADGYIDCTVFADSYKQFTKFYKKNLICKVTGKKDKEGSCIALKFE